MMLQMNLNDVALEFVQDWDRGKAARLEDYLAHDPSDAPELIDFVADYVIFEAISRPATRSRPPEG